MYIIIIFCTFYKILSMYCISRNFTRSAILSDDDLPYHIVVGMPALSPTMETGTLSEWYVEEGSGFSAGESIAKIETDKASIDFEAQDDGFIGKLLQQSIIMYNARTQMYAWCVPHAQTWNQTKQQLRNRWPTTPVCLDIIWCWNNHCNHSLSHTTVCLSQLHCIVLHCS